MAKKTEVVVILLMTLNKIRMILDAADEQLAAIEKREGDGRVPVKKQCKVVPKLPKGRIGKSVKRK